MKSHYDQKLTRDQEQLIYGGLLGDLCMVLPKGEKRNAHLQINHSSKQAEYAQFKYSIIQDFVRTPPRLINNRGWGNEIIVFTTLSHPQFTEIHKVCYQNGRKTLSLNWLEKIHSPFALAIWYMDDGALLGQRSMTISTNSFSKEEHLILQRWLHDYWGITPTIKEDKRGRGCFLLFPAEERDKFFNVIRKHVIPSMQYKVLPELKPVPCAICGNPVMPNRQIKAVAKWIVCSNPKCREARLKFYKHPKPLSRKLCVICGTEFMTKIRNKLTCSLACRHARRLQKKRIYSKEYRARKKPFLT